MTTFGQVFGAPQVSGESPLASAKVFVGNSSGIATAVTLAGDVTNDNVGNTTLATVATPGTTGSSTAIPVVTINAKGLTTGITTAAVVAPAGTLSGSTLASGVTGSSLTSVGTLTGLNTSGNVGIGNGNSFFPLQVVEPFAKTATSTAQYATFFSTNEALASAPFGLRMGLVGAATASARYVSLQTTEYNLADGGNIILEALAGNVGIGTTTPQTTLDVNGIIRTAGYTVAGLPAASSSLKGAIAYVTDALTPSFLTIVVGGGSTVTPVFCNGTNWVGG